MGTCVRVDHVQYPDRAARGGYIVHEVKRPLLVGFRVNAQRHTRTHAVFTLLSAQGQPFLAVNAMHSLVVNVLAFALQQHMQTTIAEARFLACQCDQSLA
jgi:hypothetical protein